MNTAGFMVVITDHSGIIQEIHGSRDKAKGLECGSAIRDASLLQEGNEEGWTRIEDDAYRYKRYRLNSRPGYLYILHPDRSSPVIGQEEQNIPGLDRIIGSSRVISALRETLLWIAASPSSVLITGESGTGKELFAQAIHSCGERAKYKFVKVNCAAIPENLLESELFGYVEVAFTGGRKGGRVGKFEMANKGTIFLDEIGDMPLAMQAKLLRVLQEREIEKIGGDHPIPIDVRVVSATNKDLSALISQGLFRLDLFYRLNVINLHIPALRERKEDIPLLAEHFVKQLNEKLGLTVQGIDEKAMGLLMQYHWPGNVRELCNVIETAMNFCRSNVLTAEALPPYILHQQSLGTESNTCNLKTGLMAMEYQQIRNALKASKGNRQKAAKILGISRTTLYRLMKKHQLIK
ncbi:MAG: sigma 54-interacting transcriptional regulator [Syntrophomonadaceae bacterium]|nr:sigma 54-interacting transcriptional regulator [Syntrophomonadaceae bacterium]